MIMLTCSSERIFNPMLYTGMICHTQREMECFNPMLYTGMICHTQREVECFNVNKHLYVRTNLNLGIANVSHRIEKFEISCNLP